MPALMESLHHKYNNTSQTAPVRRLLAHHNKKFLRSAIYISISISVSKSISLFRLLTNSTCVVEVQYGPVPGPLPGEEGDLLHYQAEPARGSPETRRQRGTWYVSLCYLSYFFKWNFQVVKETNKTTRCKRPKVAHIN